MGLKELSLLLLVAAAFVSSQETKEFKVVCYLGSWAHYRTGNGKFEVEDIDANLCTHAIYGFAKLENNKIEAYDEYLDLEDNSGLGAYKRFNALKEKNPGLKTLIAIGGWNEGSTKYSAMAGDASARATFVQSSIDFCKKHGFDGLDLDWEYPANRGGVAADKKNFVLLTEDLKEAFIPEGLLLTAAVAAGKWTIETAYDIAGISRNLDFINVMTYDFHGSWEYGTGHNSPLYPREGEPEGHKILNVDYAMRYWNQQGASKDKLVVGTGLYGRSFTLANPSSHGLGAPTAGAGKAGEFTKEPGMLGYNEICKNLKEGWTETFDNHIKAPYAYSGDQWVGYDNVESIGIKTEYAIEQNLAGVMVWSVETDDFRGDCGEGKYPLLSAINNKLNGKERSTEDPAFSTTRSPRTTTTPGPTTTRDPNKPPPEPADCTQAGSFRDPEDCSKFYQCVDAGNGSFTKYDYTCPESLVYDESSGVCDYKAKFPECP